jgi:hypothetical protein
VLIAGCPAVATRQTADTVAPGKWQLGAGVDGVLFRDVEQDTRVPSLVVDVGARHGVSDNVDVGARLYTFGLQAGAKWRVARGDWRVALAPAADLARTSETQVTTDALHVFGHLPIIFGHDLSHKLGINFGPRATYGYYLPATGGEAHGMFVGAFGNLSIRLHKRWTLLPELGIHRSVAGEVPVRGWMLSLGSGIAVDM